MRRVSARPILVIDGDELGREQATAALADAGFVTIETAHGENAIELVRRQQAELVLLEVSLPGASGYEICRGLREEFGELLPIILVSGERTDELDRSAALLLGADDYLAKPLDLGRLLPAVHRLLARSRASARPNLTTRELDVLSLLGAGYDRAAIATEFVISRKTVAKHIEHILAKLDVHSEAQAVASAFRERLIEVDDRRLHAVGPPDRRSAHGSGSVLLDPPL